MAVQKLASAGVAAPAEPVTHPARKLGIGAAGGVNEERTYVV